MGGRQFSMLDESGPKSESITFRLDSSILDNLRKRAKHDKVTLNTLVNQLIADYFEWSMTAKDAGWMVMPKVIISKAFEMLSQEEILRVADAAFHETKDVIIFMKGNDNLQSFLSILRSGVERSGFGLRELEKDGKTTFIIQHDMGRNYSFLFKSVLELIMHHYELQVEFETTDRTVIMFYR
ncbi:MAG: hypothetical protein M3297_08270 [Thermoproteota archaeon]|nr:hypothetical protein [Thermoproteota archaeon]